MANLIWFNGEILPAAEVRVDVEDRGFQFADGVYEVLRVYDGQPFAVRAHLDRLHRSADGIQLTLPPQFDLADAMKKLIARTGVREGWLYLQATRGPAPRNHRFPVRPTPTLLCYARPLPPFAHEAVRLHPVPDERWKRCWIKSIALLPNVLAKNAAIAAGADEAVFVDDGVVTECATSNVFAVTKGKLVTHPVGPKVLPGITRIVVLECAEKLGIRVDERALSESEALNADELFITSTTREVAAVSHWGGRTIGSGRWGPITSRLREAVRERVTADVRASR